MGRVVQIVFVSFVAVATIIFGWGFVMGLSGDAGSPVDGLSVPADEPGIRDGAERLVVMGDSLARGAGDTSGRGIGRNLEEMLEAEGVEVEWLVNLGVNGARTEDLLETLAPVGTRRTIADATLIVLSIGANDVFYESGRGGTLTDVEPDEIIQRVRTVLDEIESINESAPVFVVGLYNPFRDSSESRAVDLAVSEWNHRLSQLAAERSDVIVIPTADLFLRRDRLSADRFHPSGEAYALISSRIVQAL